MANERLATRSFACLCRCYPALDTKIYQRGTRVVDGNIIFFHLYFAMIIKQIYLVKISGSSVKTNRVQNAGEWHDEGIIPRALHRLLQGLEQLVHGGPLASRCQAQKPLGPFSSSRASRAGLASRLRRFSSGRAAIASCRTTIILTARWALLFAGGVLLVVLASRWLLAVTAHVIPYDPAVWYASMIRSSDSHFRLNCTHR